MSFSVGSAIFMTLVGAIFGTIPSKNKSESTN